MDKKTLSKQVIIEKGGIAKTSDFVAAGIPAVDIVNLCNTGYLERIRHGYYQLADWDTSSEEQLIAALIPKAIICVESALFHYGYSDFAPRKWSIAVPRSMSRTKLDIDALELQTYYVQSEIYELGKTTADFNGVMLPVYDRERTICDCFKYRSRLDNEIFNKALNAYVNDSKKDLRNLSGYAKKLRVHKKVTELMEVLLNG
ncbi:type IV toxin-antitoxin system AbiEi family antitoxin domain-containing protein [Oscillospiraceae bacterium Marseille-Q3528]|nr:type IV toxin-antitoxin system AbiEi family antitoxin domain-containing protein [Oscillospiraceae bacterium Marseille-Q3528]WNV58304.1 type IV toxin-antitoxin system AbiEi family antitoxin domain-containing protein [Oscillospiraceae bacterium NTUH-002-81]